MSALPPKADMEVAKPQVR